MISARIVVDNTNQVHYFGSDYWNNYDVLHYAWDRTSQTGVRPPYLPRRQTVVTAGVSTTVTSRRLWTVTTIFTLLLAHTAVGMKPDTESGTGV